MVETTLPISQQLEVGNGYKLVHGPGSGMSVEFEEGSEAHPNNWALVGLH